MKSLFLTLLFATSTLLIGCNTVEGVGEDISAAGDKIDREAEEKRDY